MKSNRQITSAERKIFRWTHLRNSLRVRHPTAHFQVSFERRLQWACEQFCLHVTQAAVGAKLVERSSGSRGNLRVEPKDVLVAVHNEACFLYSILKDKARANGVVCDHSFSQTFESTAGAMKEQTHLPAKLMLHPYFLRSSPPSTTSSNHCFFGSCRIHPEFLRK